MATAVGTSSQPRKPSTRAGLLTASVLGAVYVLAALAVVFYFVPNVWEPYVTPQLGGLLFVDVSLRVAVQIAAAVGLVWFGRTLAGANPPKGLRGGIFVVISALVTIFFLARVVGLNAGPVAMGVTAAVLAVVAVRVIASPRGEGWMVGLEEQGWFHTQGYKKALGQRVRRLTILGVLLVGASGVYALMFQGFLPDKWVLELPFSNADGKPLEVRLTDLRVTVPVILLALTLWVAYRVANLPTFAEFLIATEAEMNKVSWSTRRRLAQDTAVVLVTTLVLTLFLLFVDLFWGWLLSQDTVGVLPAKATGKEKTEQKEARW